MALADIEVHPAIGRFDDVAAILAPRGVDTPACWCLSYRVTSGENHDLRGEARPGFVRQLTEHEPSPGMLAYVGGEPVGWCGSGLRSQMGRLVRSRTMPPVDDKPVWSVVCFVVKAPYRRQGVARRLLDATVEYAGRQGVAAVEAYPVDTEGDKISSTFAYMGTTSFYEKAGFERVQLTQARSGGRPRWIMRKDLET
jgi:GNAT superfamily N-acetyltransferase